MATGVEVTLHSHSSAGSDPEMYRFDVGSGNLQRQWFRIRRPDIQPKAANSAPGNDCPEQNGEWKISEAAASRAGATVAFLQGLCPATGVSNVAH